VSLAPQGRNYDPLVLGLGASSVLDEVQILQLDEFQLPNMAADLTSYNLFEFSEALSGAVLGGRLPRLRQACLTSHTGDPKFFAVPFYSNISLIACQENKLGVLPSSWTEMAVACQKYSGEGLYFACHVERSNNFESYNCMFLEILYSMKRPPSGQKQGSLLDWFSADRNITTKALRCFRALLERYHRILLSRMMAVQDDEQWQNLQNELTRSALISRHWYNTLNQMLAELELDVRSHYTVMRLPGERPDEEYMTTAGDWFLAVPQYSAAPEVALDVIEFLTSRDKEMQRLHLGVGLPTQADYYRRESSHVSPYFDLAISDLRDLVQHGLRRSQFISYQIFGETLSSHLQRLLETPSPKYDEVCDDLLVSLEFIQSKIVTSTGTM